MNERIKEITGQVLDELVPETWVALGYDKIKEIQFRTAELIVRECANLFDKDEMELSLTERTIHKTIKEHFGVEE